MNFGFRRLSDPGWHPEYGFQLTLVAIAIDLDRVAGTGKNEIGHSAFYEMKGKRGYETTRRCWAAVYRSKTKPAEYLLRTSRRPMIESRTFGNAETGTIRFALPTRYLGTLIVPRSQ